ncbi:MAG: aminodeoxychorismate/anthranilate synthase component II [Elusimicrobia bacterium]|nr:aminodeoxychorismate/anthranilate synthase component II [Elusimicrobiota bacterium]
MILVIDNYDSFTYNLVQYLGEMVKQVRVFRNDQISLGQIARLKPSHIVISPGPGTPAQAGISVDVIRDFGGKIPLLGVCLGHQALGYAFGGRVIKAKRLMHGKTSWIHHDQRSLFREVPNPFEATRYHSLLVERRTLPHCLTVTAWTDQREIMGLRHKTLPRLEGVQFHPESILTKEGKRLLKNFLSGTS